MNVTKGQYGFVKIRDGHHRDEIGNYMQDVEADHDNVDRAHVAILEKRRIIITPLSNLEWLEDQQELEKKFASPEESDED